MHYSIDGEDSIPGWPSTAYADSVCSYLERAYVVYRDTLGLPVALAGDPGSGGGLVDCHIRDVPLPYSGSATSDTCFDDGECRPCRGQIAVDNTEGWRSLAVIAAHEYFHLIEMRVRTESSLFAESAAQWAQTIAFPRGAIDLYGTWSWFRAPYLSFWDSVGDRAYGAVLYWTFLEQTQGRYCAAELWKRDCAETRRATLERILEEKGTSFDQTLAQFAIWRAVTGPCDDGRHFRDGAELPEISCQAVHGSFPVHTALLPSELLARPAASNYIRFLGPGSHDSLRIRVDGDPDLRDKRTYSLVITRGQVHHAELTLAPDSAGDAVFTIADWPRCDFATLIVTNFEAAQGNLDFRYAAEETGAGAGNRIAGLVCTPNPFASETTIRYQNLGPTQQGSLTVFNLFGQRVWEMPLGLTRQGTVEIVWNGNDHRGSPVPHGAYVARAQFGSAVRTTKVIHLH